MDYEDERLNEIEKELEETNDDSRDYVTIFQSTAKVSVEIAKSTTKARSIEEDPRTHVIRKETDVSHCFEGLHDAILFLKQGVDDIDNLDRLHEEVLRRLDAEKSSLQKIGDEAFRDSLLYLLAMVNERQVVVSNRKTETLTAKDRAKLDFFVKFLSFTDFKAATLYFRNALGALEKNRSKPTGRVMYLACMAGQMLCAAAGEAKLQNIFVAKHVDVARVLLRFPLALKAVDSLQASIATNENLPSLRKTAAKYINKATPLEDHNSRQHHAAWHAVMHFVLAAIKEAENSLTSKQPSTAFKLCDRDQAHSELQDMINDCTEIDELVTQAEKEASVLHESLNDAADHDRPSEDIIHTACLVIVALSKATQAIQAAEAQRGASTRLSEGQRTVYKSKALKAVERLEGAVSATEDLRNLRSLTNDRLDDMKEHEEVDFKDSGRKQFSLVWRQGLRFVLALVKHEIKQREVSPVA